MNSLFPSKDIHRHTWYSPNGSSKRLDYILDYKFAPEIKFDHDEISN